MGGIATNDITTFLVDAEVEAQKRHQNPKFRIPGPETAIVDPIIATLDPMTATPDSKTAALDIDTATLVHLIT